MQNSANFNGPKIVFIFLIKNVLFYFMIKWPDNFTQMH